MTALILLIDQIVNLAKRRGHDLPSDVKVGMMLETPGMAWAIDRVLDQLDFVAVGANDLMQYFFAADRENPRVSERYDVLSPSALEVFKQIADRCAAAKVPVSVCGEIAAKPLEAAVLIALGYRSLSMAANNIGPIKKVVSGLDAAKLGTWLASHMDDPVNSLRSGLLEAGPDAGLPLEAVDNARNL